MLNNQGDASQPLSKLLFVHSSIYQLMVSPFLSSGMHALLLYSKTTATVFSFLFFQLRWMALSFWLHQILVAVKACGIFVAAFRSFVVVHGLLSSWGTSVVGVYGLSCPGTHGFLIPLPGMSPALEGRFVTTGPPGKSPAAVNEAFAIYIQTGLWVGVTALAIYQVSYR